MRRGDLAVVEWVDAIGPADLDAGERMAPERVKTCGWVWDETEQYVTLAPEWFERGDARAATSIPKGMILKIRVVEEHR